jgi:hypothetical protein
LLDQAPAEPQPELKVEAFDASIGRILESGVWGGETGKWHSKTQLIFDGSANQLARKLYTVWDPMPSRDLDFSWTPASGTRSNDAIVSGEGHLVWRTRTLPAYDVRSVVIDYYGAMRNGRPEGRGRYRDTAGVEYEGEWTDGNMQGQGSFKLPNGEQYEGEFVAGRPQGRGRYIDASGEIYLGPFVAGRRNGVGTTILPNGTTYQSEWQNGREAESSRSVRLAQAAGAGGAAIPGAGDIWLNIRVSRTDPALFKNEDGGEAEAARAALGYVGDNTQSGLAIRPDNRRLMDMWKGDAQIQLTPSEELGRTDLPDLSYGVFSIGKTLLPPLDLIMEVLNRTTSPVQITGLYVDVDRSVSDLEPAIQVSAGLAGRMCGGAEVRHRPAYNPKLTFENFGWGAAQNAKMRFGFVNPTGNSAPQYEITKSLGDIDQISTASFEPELQAAGVDTGRLATQAKTTRGFRCRGAADIQTAGTMRGCLVEIGGGKVFGTLLDKIANPPGAEDASTFATTAAGVLEYDWTDAGGQTHHRVSPLRPVLWLGQILIEAECGDGSTTERIARGSLKLQVDRADYRISVPFQRQVPAGRVGSYSMLIEAPRSSQHDFTIVLQLADGREIRSRPVNLLYFLPSWYP